MIIQVLLTIRMHDLFLRLHAVPQHVISQYIHIDVCIVRNAEICYIKYYHAIYALFAQCERLLTQLCKNYTF